MFRVQEVPPAIVRLEFAGGMSVADEAAYLEALDRLSIRDAPFVVVALLEGRNPLSTEGKKRQALWFKRSRERLGACCRGLVRVPSGDAHEGLGDEALAKALPFPLAHAASEAEAMRIARSLLAGGR
jgi:hypothetical protein